MKGKVKLRLADFIAVAVFIFAIVLSLLRLPKNKGRSALLVIQSAKGEEVYPLDQNSTHLVQGPLGTSVIKIQNGKAFFESSPCPNQTCVEAGLLQNTGDWASCLPNEIFIRIEGGAEKPLDAVSQ